MPESYPKILVVTPTRFNLKAGGGVTMGNLFRGWPKEKIAQVYSTEFIKPDTTVCEKYITGRFDLSKKTPLNSKYLDDFLNSKDNKFFLKSNSIDISDIVKRIKNVFKPEVIYTDARDNPPYYLWLGRILAKEFNIPYVVHVMDDWPNRFSLNNNNVLDNLIHKTNFTQELKNLFSDSSLNICISPEMCTEYEARYGHKFIPFHNTIDLEDWIHNEKFYDQEDETFTITYIGAVTDDKELFSLIDIKNAVIELNEQGYDCQFNIYTADPWKENAIKHLTWKDKIGYAGFLKKEDLPLTLTQSDLLVLPINFDENSLSYIGLSIQTKVPEYMASGTPSLVYAPSISPNSRYAREEGWGLTVEKQDHDLLVQTIKELIQNEELRQRLGTKGRALAQKNHDATKVRESFKNSIQSIIQNVRHEVL